MDARTKEEHPHDKKRKGNRNLGGLGRFRDRGGKGGGPNPARRAVLSFAEFRVGSDKRGMSPEKKARIRRGGEKRGSPFNGRRRGVYDLIKLRIWPGEWCFIRADREG